MNFFRQGSIKKKLTLIIMVISSTALLLACLAFIVYDLITFKNQMTEDLNSVAEIIGTNSAAALDFDNQNDAEETLMGLKVKGHITSACIYKLDGEVLAQYHRDDKPIDSSHPKPKISGFEFTKNRLHVFHEIFLDENKIGTVYLQSDLDELNARPKRYAVIILAVLGASMLAAFLMTSRLQRIVSEPIRSLANTAKKVSDNKDFSVRAEKFSNDELGFLTERFNEMLTQIQDRDNTLQKIQTQLKKQAKKLQVELKGRKEFEKALSKSEERFKDLFDNAPDMYIIMDPNGVIIDFNQRVLKVLGYKSEDIFGKPLKNIVHHEDTYTTGKYIQKIRESGQPPKNIEVRLIHKNGQSFWVSKESSLSKDSDGKLLSVRLICREITENKRLQEELDRARRLESAGRLAGQISHDFNNLLGPLAAYPTLIREELPEDHPVLGMLDEMESAAMKIAEINQQLLSLGRRGHYPRELVDLNQLIENNITMSQSLNKKIVFNTKLESNLFLIKGGGAQLTRALTNLILNAHEAMQGKGIVRIQTQNVYLDKQLGGYQTINRGEYVKLDISDRGSGIKPDLMQKIFDPFFTTKIMDRMRGSGLGLSVVHGIIEDHNGYITVKSLVKKGTTFSLYFPVSRDQETESTDTIEKIEGGDESILIVDDDPIQRRVTSQLLTRLGYDIHTVTSGEQAVDYVKEKTQDLLLLDMVMDGIDGTETYKRILQLHPQQKALVFSGYAKTNRVRTALKLGAGGFISKPISLSSLAQAVRIELDKN